MTLEGVLEAAADRLRRAGVESPIGEARRLFAHVSGSGLDRVIAGIVALDKDLLTRYEGALAERESRCPFAYITGRREFWSLEFAVGRGVLIPRPETESLVEAALERHENDGAPMQVLDLGTGSGCLLLAFLVERPAAHGTGIDVSEIALSWARHNAQTHGLESRTDFLLADWSTASGRYDIIFANPPYIADVDLSGLDPEVAAYEPASALSGGADGLAAYRSLAPVLARCLKSAGKAYIEIGINQARAVRDVLNRSGLDVQAVVPDLSGTNRCLVVGLAQKRLATALETG